MPGRYEALFQYLDKRFANRVVLTFAQVEDLIGFPLPDAAHLEREWWTSAASRDGHTLAWTSASRTATPNLGAETVAFERL